MEELLSNNRQIAFHRVKLDYVASPVDSLQFAYGDRRYDKMAIELFRGSDVIRVRE